MVAGQSTILSATRIPWMDRVRVVTIAGVVVAHTATAYLVEIGWYYEERTTSATLRDVLIVPFVPVAIYGLAPLFLIAGWLSGKSLSRETPARFARSRLLRLGVPLLVYFVLVDPLADYLGSLYDQPRRSLGSYLVDLGGDRDLGVVWFVTALLVFSLVLAAWRGARRRHPRSEGIEEPVRVATLATIAGVVAAADFLVWLRWIYTDTAFWNAQVQHWPQAAGVFVLGLLAFERGWFATITSRLARGCGWLTIGCLLAGVGLGATQTGEPPPMLGGWHLSALAFAVLDGVTAVCLCIWLAHWMGRRWNAPLRPWLRLASRGSYAAYLLHPLVLVVISLAMRPVPVPPEVKFVLVAVVGVPACFAVGYLATRVPGARAVL